ncbi:MAG: Gfo/Idh/MocA family oxidoreductase, partial [Verrucomicrobiae bacterium]|nr:Gfo/Idh/MocA family oxidoreductase [Verrucomicrobiae bacterium]
ARARSFALRHGIPKVHASYAELVQDPELDAIYVPLPNSMHAEWSIRGLKAGKHILCEKPLAANAREAELMAKASTESGRVLVEAFHYRYHPLAARLKAIVDSGELGTIQHMEAHFCVPLIIPGDIRYRYELGGGATMDLGCYTINILRYLAGGEPRVCEAYARLSSPQVDRYMEAKLEFPDGRTGRIVCSLFSLVLVRSLVVIRGTGGILHVTGPFHPHIYHRIKIRRGCKVRTERVPGDSTFTYQLRAFVQAVQGKRLPLTDAHDAIANMQVIDAIYERAGLQPRGMRLVHGQPSP